MSPEVGEILGEEALNEQQVYAAPFLLSLLTAVLSKQHGGGLVHPTPPNSILGRLRSAKERWVEWLFLQNTPVLSVELGRLRTLFLNGFCRRRFRSEERMLRILPPGALETKACKESFPSKLAPMREKELSASARRAMNSWARSEQTFLDAQEERRAREQAIDHPRPLHDVSEAVRDVEENLPLAEAAEGSLGLQESQEGPPLRGGADMVVGGASSSTGGARSSRGESSPSPDVDVPEDSDPGKFEKNELTYRGKMSKVNAALPGEPTDGGNSLHPLLGETTSSPPTEGAASSAPSPPLAELEASPGRAGNPSSGVKAKPKTFFGSPHAFMSELENKILDLDLPWNRNRGAKQSQKKEPPKAPPKLPRRPSFQAEKQLFAGHLVVDVCCALRSTPAQIAFLGHVVRPSAEDDLAVFEAQAAGGPRKGQTDKSPKEAKSKSRRSMEVEKDEDPLSWDRPSAPPQVARSVQPLSRGPPRGPPPDPEEEDPFSPSPSRKPLRLGPRGGITGGEDYGATGSSQENLEKTTSSSGGSSGREDHDALRKTSPASSQKANPQDVDNLPAVAFPGLWRPTSSASLTDALDLAHENNPRVVYHSSRDLGPHQAPRSPPRAGGVDGSRGPAGSDSPRGLRGLPAAAGPPDGTRNSIHIRSAHSSKQSFAHESARSRESEDDEEAEEPSRLCCNKVLKRLSW